MRVLLKLNSSIHANLALTDTPPKMESLFQSPDLITKTDQITSLKKRKHKAKVLLNETRKPWKAHQPFGYTFWVHAFIMEAIRLERSKLDREIALCSFDGDETAWEQTDKAKASLEQIRAREQSLKIYEGCVQRSLDTPCMNLLTTSTIGSTMKPGAGKQYRAQQSQFQAKLVKKYAAGSLLGGRLWCPIMHDWRNPCEMTSFHLFPYIHGQATMNAIFGKVHSKDLFSARNGLLISKPVAEYLDRGKIAIVPSINDTPNFATKTCWPCKSSQEYEIKILDPSWELLGSRISVHSTLTWGQLDSRKLQFRSSSRPAARYMYYHYCVQLIKAAWQRKDTVKKSDTAGTLEKGTSIPIWTTPGQYISRSMLLAVVQELGDEYTSLIIGARCSRSEAPQHDLLLEVVAKQVKYHRPEVNSYSSIEGGDLEFYYTDSDSEEDHSDGEESDFDEKYQSEAEIDYLGSFCSVSRRCSSRYQYKEMPVMADPDDLLD